MFQLQQENKKLFLFLINFGQNIAELREMRLGGINQSNSHVLSHLQHAPRSIVHAVLSTGVLAARSSAVWQDWLGGHFIMERQF